MAAPAHRPRRTGSPQTPRRPAPHRPPTPPGAAAFTLLEIMIVVGMAAMVMAISIPFVQRTIRQDEVYRAVHLVDDACRQARAAAILNNTTATLVIHPEDKAFSVQANAAPLVRRTPDDSDHPSAPRPSAPRRASRPFSGSLDDDVSIEMLDINFTDLRDAEEAKVQFHPNGTSDEFTIVLRIGATAWRRLTLDMVTGTPMIEVMR